MQVEKFSFDDTGQFAPLFIDFINKAPRTKQFYDQYPDHAGFSDQLKSKKLDASTRNVLANCLDNQYHKPGEEVGANIAALRDQKTFTITTGHQLNIFTGPLYFIYKIVTVINACKELKEKHPEYNFVPVYWMASEDHDFEEISYFHLFGKKYTWETNQKGAVGRMNPQELKKILDAMPGKHPVFEEAYLKHERLSDAVRYYVDALFGSEGLVVIDADTPELKKLFAPVVKDELLKSSTEALVAQQSAVLEETGYKPQISPREINLFYLDDQLRKRIIREDGAYRVLDSELQFSSDEILALVDSNPERFSPNVILRPLYQEMILPNLAYTGGPAEVIYWMQLKLVFDYFETSFPILLPRNFALIIDAPTNRKMEKTGAETSDVLLSHEDVLKKLVAQVDKDEILVEDEISAINKLFNALADQVKEIDPTLVQTTDAEREKTVKSLLKVSKKGNRAILRRHSDLDSQITSWYETLHPNGGIQERTLNFLNFAMDDPEFLQKVKQTLQPFDLKFHVISE